MGEMEGERKVGREGGRERELGEREVERKLREREGDRGKKERTWAVIFTFMQTYGEIGKQLKR